MAEPEQNKIKQESDELDSKMVQTYAGDMAQAIGGEQGGLIKKIIHEEEVKQEEHSNPEQIKNKIFMAAGILLLVLALGTVVYLSMNRKEIGTVPVATFTTMIFTDKSASIDATGLTKDQLAQALWAEIDASEVKYGGIEEVTLTLNSRGVGLRGFITILKGALVLSGPQLVDDNFLLGFYTWEARSPFILIKVRSIPDIFNSMRSWEAKMFYDLHGIFGTDINADTNDLLTKSFEDTIVENKNARILYGAGGEVILVYVYLDDSHIIIANDLVAVHEVATRLAGSRIKQ
jgi:hypothetical protein